MARPTVVLASVALLVALSACEVDDGSDGPGGGHGNATPPPDAGGAPDGAVADELPPPDAGSPPTDEGPSVRPDAGPPADVGAHNDAGTSTDAGVGPDAATPDAGTGPDAGAPLIVVTEVVVDGLSCLRIETPAATYLYDRDGAGFVSLVDRDGNDWIGFGPGAGASGEYRGIPNMGRCCHPGYDGATTRIAAEDRELVRIESSGVVAGDTWRVTWDFTPEHATLTVHDAPRSYYLLYEGTPGGSVGPEDYFITSAGAATRTPIYTDDQDELITDDLPGAEWIYFADGALGRGLLLVHHEDDAIGDRYWTMSYAMTVFGFGRTGQGGVTGLDAAPQHMTIALLDAVDFESAERVAEALIP